MLDFVKSNYMLVIAIILTCINIVLTLIKKNKSTDSNWSLICSMIPGFICKAEKIYTKGEDKLTYVLALVSSMLVKDLDIDDDSIIQYYIARAREYTEEVLSTPQKKGVIDENKTKSE